MRQSFWSTMRTSPSLTTSAESPPGPSVMLVSTWMATRQPAEVELLAVGRCGSRLVNPSAPHPAVELAGRVAGQQHADVAGQVVAQPRLVPVVAVEVGDVEVVGAVDARQQVVVELVVAGEREPRAEERRHEPRVAQDRAVLGLDEDPGVAERRGAHHRPPTLPAGPGAARGCSASGDGRVGVLLAGARHVLGPRRAVPVAQLVAAGRVGVPPGGHASGWPASPAWPPAVDGRTCWRRCRPAPPAAVVGGGVDEAVPHEPSCSTPAPSPSRPAR